MRLRYLGRGGGENGVSVRRARVSCTASHAVLAGERLITIGFAECLGNNAFLAYISLSLLRITEPLVYQLFRLLTTLCLFQGQNSYPHEHTHL